MIIDFIFVITYPAFAIIERIIIVIITIIISLLASYTHQREPMVFHRSLNDSKSPKVSRTLLKILAALYYAAVWIVSSHLPISKSANLLTKRLGTVASAPVIIGITVSFIFHNFFLVPWQGLSTSSPFTFFDFHSVVCRDGKINYMASSLFLFFLFNYLKLWSSGRDKVICCKSKSIIISLFESFSLEQ